MMNRIQKAATAFVALAVTLVGAALSTAPLVLADIGPAVSHQGISSIAQSSTASMAGSALRRG